MLECSREPSRGIAGEGERLRVRRVAADEGAALRDLQDAPLAAVIKGGVRHHFSDESAGNFTARHHVLSREDEGGFGLVVFEARRTNDDPRNAGRAKVVFAFELFLENAPERVRDLVSRGIRGSHAGSVGQDGGDQHDLIPVI